MLKSSPFEIDSTLPAPDWPLVAISILNWNGWQDTLECLESVRQLDYPNYLTVVVDNGSRDGSAEKIKAWAEERLGPGHVLAEYTRATALQGGDAQLEAALDRARSPGKLVLVRNEENLGFAGGNNVAIHYALRRKSPAGYLFFLNNDAAVAPDCLSHLVRAAQQNQVGVAGATIYDQAGQRVIAGPLTLAHLLLPHGFERWRAHSHAQRGEFTESFAAQASAALIRGEALRAVWRSRGEYFEDRLFMYGDELPLAYALRKAGFRCLIAKRAMVRHKYAQSSGGIFNPVSCYYLVRNRLYVAKEILPGSRKLIFYFLHPSTALAQAAKNLLCRRPRSAWAILCGLVDSYRGIGGKWKHHDTEATRKPRCETVNFSHR
jgi:hypothetical protein